MHIGISPAIINLQGGLGVMSQINLLISVPMLALGVLRFATKT
jgi:hypothetical protein